MPSVPLWDGWCGNPRPENMERPMAVSANLCPDGKNPIWTKDEMESPLQGRLPQWAQSSYDAFIRKVRDNRFPCFFATTAERRGQVLYAFAETTTCDDDIEHAEATIETYLNRLERLPQAEADMTVLVLMIGPCPGSPSLSDYADKAWNWLSHLHHRDKVPWPPDLPTDVNDPRWSYALAGVPLFINVSTPANLKRKSRNLGPNLSFIISPRDVFDRVAPADEKGERIRVSIRRRSANYDGIPSPPWTVRYGEGQQGGERKQYMLPDDNEQAIEVMLEPKRSGCPYRGST